MARKVTTEAGATIAIAKAALALLQQIHDVRFVELTDRLATAVDVLKSEQNAKAPKRQKSLLRDVEYPA